jgi:hypothetical protein
VLEHALRLPRHLRFGLLGVFGIRLDGDLVELCVARDLVGPFCARPNSMVGTLPRVILQSEHQLMTEEEEEEKSDNPRHQHQLTTASMVSKVTTPTRPSPCPLLCSPRRA